MPTIVPTLLTAFAAALITFSLGQTAEILKRRREFTHRWDADLFEIAQSFVASTRRLESLTAADDVDLAAVRSTHTEIRAQCNQLLVLADHGVARAALQLQRDCYALVQLGAGTEDPRPGAAQPKDRYFSALHLLYVELRRQLRIAPLSTSRLPD